uniref:Uncharacterized protein n=1 Tax=Arundo donax TaxID=35708 RepID=A0A0A8ZS65_ARUDO
MPKMPHKRAKLCCKTNVGGCVRKEGLHVQ